MIFSQDDAWSATFKPPKNESEKEKQDRIRSQQEAARISREIDDDIERSRRQHEKRKKAVKVLLLGQAESGKSTMLRNFQFAFSPTYFHREIPIWKVIIQLNLIGSVKKLLAIIDDQLNLQSPLPSLPSSALPTSIPRAPFPPLTTPSSPPSQDTSVTRRPDLPSSDLTPTHAALRLRLLPLLNVETNLARQLLPEFGGASPPLPSSTGWAKWASGAGRQPVHDSLFGTGEICVRAGGAWKAVLERVTGARNSLDSALTDLDLHSASGKHAGRAARHHPSDPTPLLEALAPDIHALWTDVAIQALLNRKGVHMEHSAGFFLNDVMRIAKPGWKPGIDDIVRARLRTFGVEEHVLTERESSEWYIYDVGGSRGSRHQWVPYFDDVQAIIFLAPLLFDQVLDEDTMVNRLEDSLSLWKDVCTSPLLARANVILFLNKMDILESTLKSGVRVQTYVPSYGSNPNELESVVKYFREKFRAYHKRLSPKPRPFFCHRTSAIDTAATQTVLAGVREGILRTHLEKINVI